MNKLLTTLAATVFVATAALGMAAETASTPVKVETHSAKVSASATKHTKAPAHAKKHTSVASAVQKAQAKKHASAASAVAHKAPVKKHASAASAV